MKIKRDSLAYKIVKANFPNEYEHEYSNLCPFGRRLIASILFSPVTWIGFAIEAVVKAINKEESNVPFVIRAIVLPIVIAILVVIPFLVGDWIVDGYLLSWITGAVLIAVGVILVVLIVKFLRVIFPKLYNALDNSINSMAESSVPSTISAFIKATHDKICPIITFEESKTTE